MIVLPPRTEVFVRTESGQSPTRTTHTSSTYVITDPNQGNQKADISNLDIDLEQGSESEKWRREGKLPPPPHFSAVG